VASLKHDLGFIDGNADWGVWEKPLANESRQNTDDHAFAGSLKQPSERFQPCLQLRTEASGADPFNRDLNAQLGVGLLIDFLQRFRERDKRV